MSGFTGNVTVDGGCLSVWRQDEGGGHFRQEAPKPSKIDKMAAREHLDHLTDQVFNHLCELQDQAESLKRLQARPSASASTDELRHQRTCVSPDDEHGRSRRTLTVYILHRSL